MALAVALAQPWADVVLSGAATLATLRSNLGAAELIVPEELDERLAGLREDREAYWRRRAELPWN